MNHNPFMPREQRTAILTFDNGQRVRAEILIPKSDRQRGTTTSNGAS